MFSYKRVRIFISILCLASLLFTGCAGVLPENGEDEPVMTAGQALSTAARKGNVAADQDRQPDGEDAEDPNSPNTGSEKNNKDKKSGDEGPRVMAVSKAVTCEKNIRDEASLYEGIDDAKVLPMYLTVRKGNASDGSDHTWEEINKYSVYDYDEMGVDRYKVEGILQVDESGNGIGSTDFGFNAKVPNVTVQIRGQTSSRSNQKNFKIHVKDGCGECLGLRTMALNKHVADPGRFANKMCYDLLETIPQLMSCRTYFVHLYVKDETASGNGGDFTDYGLFTMTEPINRRYLKTHGLDENGQLYKVSFFEWNQIDVIMEDQDSSRFDRDAFEDYLKIKGDEDVSKLQEVIKKLHTYSIPIDEIISQHFDEENLCYWMAFNILNGNYDVGARNVYLYSPLNSEKFYMLCWDMDGSFKNGFFRNYQDHIGEPWTRGMTKFLGLKLTNRMLKEEKYRMKLTAAIEDLYRNYMDPQTVSDMAQVYSNIALPYVISQPDQENAGIKEPEEYLAFTGHLGDEITENYRNYYDTLVKPWPFFVNAPIANTDAGTLKLTWEAAYDCDGEEVHYDYILARDEYLEDVVDSGKGLLLPTVTVPLPSPGTYYLKVRAINASGYSSECFDYISDRDEGDVFGCYRFRVESDRSITVEESVE
ncbi:MAG: CotH kinase family protein [Lachnospiraceae bacterium]|nr:CotH kinase family protein [Lachnospiraceae bacterium]